ncbi:MAG: hypothetical protein ACREF9_06185, partial [Opitutaceae bacterium]
MSVNSGGVVTGSIGGLPGGYVLTGSSNGHITVTGPGGASLSSTPGGGTTLTLPGGTAVTVNSVGAISMSVPGSTGALVQNALYELGRLLGLDLGGNDVRGQVIPVGAQPTQGAWENIRNILLGNRPPGVYDIATTSDTRGVPESPTPPAPANIIRIRLTVLPPPVPGIQEVYSDQLGENEANSFTRHNPILMATRDREDARLAIRIAASGSSYPLFVGVRREGTTAIVRSVVAVPPPNKTLLQFD